MKPADWMLFGLTFLTGVFIGASLYLFSFKPTYAPEGLAGDEDKAMEFSIIGKTYGGMVGPEYIRPSFRLLADGSYSYIPGGTGDDALTPFEGSLSRGLMSDVRAVIDESALRAAGQPIEKESCRLYVDGVEYQYQVILNGTLYQLDTCRTNISYESDLATVLESVWAEFGGETYSGSLEVTGQRSSGNSISDRAEEWLRGYFDSDSNK